MLKGSIYRGPVRAMGKRSMRPPGLTPSSIPTGSFMQAAEDIARLKNELQTAADTQAAEYSAAEEQRKAEHEQRMQELDAVIEKTKAHAEKMGMLIETIGGRSKEITGILGRAADVNEELGALVESEKVRIRTIAKGDPGKNAEPVDQDSLIERILLRLPPPQKGDPGKNPDPALIVRMVLDILPKSDPVDEKVLLDKIVRHIKENKILTPDHIDGLPSKIRELQSRGAYIHGGGDTVEAGTGVSIVKLPSGRKQISALSGGFTKLPATGDVDSSNLIFTFTQAPTYIVADGIWLEQQDSNGNDQWTIVGLTVTMVNAPIFSIYGVA